MRDPDRRPPRRCASASRDARSWAASGAGLGVARPCARLARPEAARCGGRRRSLAAAASPQPCTSRRGPSASSTSTRPAARRTSSCSTTSRSSRADARPAHARVLHRGPADRPAPGTRSCAASAPQHSVRSATGQSGQEMSTLLPHIGSIADEICIVRSMQTEQINHDPAHTFMNTGTQISGRPSRGLLDLVRHRRRRRGPARASSCSPRTAAAARCSPSRPGSGTAASCPAASRASSSAPRATRVLYLRDPDGRHPRAAARRDRRGRGAHPEPAGLGGRPRRSRPASASTRWRSGCRRAVPALTDFANEPQARARRSTASRAWTAPSPPTACWRGAWPSAACASSSSTTATGTTTAGIKADIAMKAREVDQASAALVKDLKQRGMLERHARDLGRRVRADARWPRATAATITSRASRSGWRAAASRAASPTAPPTSSATWRWRTRCPSTTSTPPCCTSSASTTRKLTFKFLGRDFRLTDVHGEVVKKILA